MKISSMIAAFMESQLYRRIFSSKSQSTTLTTVEVSSGVSGDIQDAGNIGADLAEADPGFVVEIDRTTKLPLMEFSELECLEGIGRCFLVPDMVVDVRLHPLSVQSGIDAEKFICSNRQFNTIGTLIAKIEQHYWFPETGFLISKEGKVWRHSLLAQYIDPHFLSTTAIVEKRNDDESIEYVFKEHLLEDVRTIKEQVLITSHYASHNFGHFMLDMVPLIQIGMKEGIKLVSRPLLDWQKQVYRRIGVDPDTVEVVTEPVVFLEKVFTSNLHHASSTMAPSPWHRQVFAEILGNVPKNIRNRKSGKRIFLSRNAAKTRVIRNRDELEERLIGEGFEIVRPETLSFDEQISIFAQAELVVSEFGAIMVNVVFCREGTKVIELIPEDQNDPWSVNLCASLKLEHVVLFHKIKDEDRESLFFGDREHKNIYFSFDADIDLVISTIRQL